MLEHDDDDRYITQSVFEEHQYDIQIDFVNTSNEMFEYLRGCGSPEKSYPALILLNYHVSPSNAVEVLKQLKASERLRHIPVIVLSGSKHHAMVEACYAAGASSFVQKPADQQSTDMKISNFVKYWFETVELS